MHNVVAKLGKCFVLCICRTSGHTPDFMTCTERLQQWNKPRPHRLEVIPVNELNSRKLQILKQDFLEESPANYDPCPLPMWSVDSSSLEEQLRADLANELGNSVFLQILVLHFL